MSNPESAVSVYYVHEYEALEKAWRRIPRLKQKNAREVYTFEQRERFDVEKAISLTHQFPQKYLRVLAPVENMANLITNVTTDDSVVNAIPSLPAVEFDSHHNMGVKFNAAVAPLILMTDHVGHLRVMDGNHRIRALLNQGYDSAFAWVFDSKQTDAVRVPFL